MEQATTPRKRLEEILRGLDAERLGTPPEVLREFARRLLARAPADFLARRAPEDAIRDVHELWTFVEEADPDGISVRIRSVPDGSARLAVETVMPDCAFIVNTLREYLHAEGFDLHHVLHPVVVLDRDEEGRIVAVRDRTAPGTRTSVVYIGVEGRADEQRRRVLESEIRSRLRKLRLATSDYRRMLERGREIVEELEEKKEEIPWRAAEFEEVQELLRWLEDDCFLYLGYRGYRVETDEEGRSWIQVEPESGLGILQEEEDSRYSERTPVDELPAPLRARVLGGPLLIVSKTNAESPVQRRDRMDYIGVKRLGPDGDVRGEHRFLGLFTAKAFGQDASTIPILRRKLREILETMGAAKGSHDYNQVLQIFNAMPKEDLFLASVSELVSEIETAMEMEGVDEVRVTARPDALARGVNVMVILPKHRFSAEVRRKIQDELVDSFRGGVLNYHLALGEGDQARLHFYLASGLPEPAEVDLDRLEDRVRDSVRSWEERLSDALERTHETERAHDLADRHRDDFSAEYRASVDVETAVEDIERLESLEATGVHQVVLESVDPERPHASRLKVFAPRARFVLSDVMPMLENLGFRVLEADKYDIASEQSGRASTIHLFEVETPEAWDVDREEAEARVADVLRAVQGGWGEDDRLNSLVLSAGLTWGQVAVLRSYAGYAFRIGAVTSRRGVQRPLTEYPELARTLWRIYAALFDPDPTSGGNAEVRRLLHGFRESLDRVRGIEDDRTYRRLLELVQATVRTNYFRPGGPRETGGVALKFDCTRVEFMPRPRPKWEVYLSGPRTEAAHLRMDDVARGGIRWSDRSEDFRVEVLGLVKTQQVKNAVIVPAGAKGAFIVKAASGEVDPADASRSSYREFIGALLDLTDNVVDGEVRHPEHTVIRDGSDPYLVVAADKGTARFSDTANSLAAERSFWLGDAFASGGSRGYDHKKLGITARGAWECVKRHFHELGIEMDEPFSVVGIGDMSGDVFGNGMLLSDRIRLLAAFDHRHVFVDPEPDPERSFRERARLYELPGSSWADYDPEVLSEEGGVFERGAKEIHLSSSARAALAIEDDRPMNADALIREILKAPVDLLWNGGIGTYVKAADERDSDVGDPGNDSVRVDGRDVRARVVAEGGNLGLTQRGRVEYALGGGKLNTDALDNSAGVDMSDHEVNLKILLNGAIDAGLLEMDERNRLLERVTDAVTADVLSHNASQSLAVSLDERRARESPAEFRDALVLLEREGGLARDLEFLPSNEELLERQEEGRPLTRPELAVILAYAKMHLKARILETDLPDDPALGALVREYFPEAVREVASEEFIRGHRLRRHIAASVLTNRFVDRMGATAHVQLVRETGKAPAEVARMWHAACAIGEADPLYQTLRGMGEEVPSGVQAGWLLDISRVLGRVTLWLLTKADPDRSVGEIVDRFRDPLRRIRGSLSELVSEAARGRLEERRGLHETDGLDSETARTLATFHVLDELMPVARLTCETRLAPEVVARVYFGIAEDVDFPWVHDQLARLPMADLWVQRAAKTLGLQLETARARITAGILRRVEGADDVEDALSRFRRRFAADLERIRHVLQDVRTIETPNVAALMVAVHAIGSRRFVEEWEEPEEPDV